MGNLISETMLSYNEYIAKLPEGCQNIADNIRIDNLSAALKSILEFSEGVSWLIDANNILEKNSFIILLNTEKINEFLIEINNGLEIQDYVVVADMFEYEIKNFFEECSYYEISEVE